MQVFGIDTSQITDLATQVANAGALELAERAGDELFDMVVGIAIVVYEQDTPL